MQNFIVLGYIPGTQIQINFSGWLIISLIFAIGLFVQSAIRHRQTIYLLFFGLYASRIIRLKQPTFIPAFK